MIQYLQRLKRKKGFTLVELAVVVGIIVVLTAIIMVNMIGGDTEKILSANSNAQSFFTASQITLTRAHLTERELVTFAPGETKYIEYKDGLNTLNGKKLFIEAHFNENGIDWLHVDNYLNKLMARGESDTMTTLEKYLSASTAENVAESVDGYFYAMCDENFTVTYAHYCKDRLPQYTTGEELAPFRDKYMFGVGMKLPNMSNVIGVCTDTDPAAAEIQTPVTGDYAFGIPTSFGDYLSA